MLIIFGLEYKTYEKSRNYVNEYTIMQSEHRNIKHPIKRNDDSIRQLVITTIKIIVKLISIH